MGAEIHITRAPSLSDLDRHPIALEQWLGFVATDALGVPAWVGRRSILYAALPREVPALPALEDQGLVAVTHRLRFTRAQANRPDDLVGRIDGPKSLLSSLHRWFPFGLEDLALEGAADNDLAWLLALVDHRHFAVNRGPAILLHTDADEFDPGFLALLVARFLDLLFALLAARAQVLRPRKTQRRAFPDPGPGAGALTFELVFLHHQGRGMVHGKPKRVLEVQDVPRLLGHRTAIIAGHFPLDHAFVGHLRTAHAQRKRFAFLQAAFADGGK